MRRVSSIAVASVAERPLTSDELAARVLEARQAGRERLAGTGWTVNSEVPGSWLRGTRMKLGRQTTDVLDRALSLGTLSLRGYDRTLRVAWTIADLSGHTVPNRSDISRALTLREEF